MSCDEVVLHRYFIGLSVVILHPWILDWIDMTVKNFLFLLQKQKGMFNTCLCFENGTVAFTIYESE